VSPEPDDALGAHVSAAGGVERAPERAAALPACVLQLFTKQPNRWADPELTPERVAAFRAERQKHDIRTAAAHDSYLINLASPDPVLLERSIAAFHAELVRAEALGLELLVTHPGNATDGDRERGARQNARAITHALHTVPGRTRVLLETTAGSGTALGSSFAGLASMVRDIADEHPDRIGVCLDTCHVWAAGYDLRDHYDQVMDDLQDELGLQHVHMIHLNDSRGTLGSHLDRHAGIGDGELGEEPFRRLLTDPRFDHTPMVLETPKGDDAVTADRANLCLLRSYRAGRSHRYS
jgi:deoxyribonuclease-4